MTSTAAENKEFVTEYLRSLSGQVKTDELVARFVSDPALASILVVEDHHDRHPALPRVR